MNETNNWIVLVTLTHLFRKNDTFSTLFENLKKGRLPPVYYALAIDGYTHVKEKRTVYGQLKTVPKGMIDIEKNLRREAIGLPPLPLGYR